MSVREYYDGNTGAFLKPWRGSSSTGALHRALWAPGVKTRDQAMHHVHELILEHLRAGGALARGALLADLGCGVGATLEYLGARLHQQTPPLPVTLAGVTLSTVQAERAREKLGSAARIHTGDFMAEETYQAITTGMETPISGAWMIESFVHAPDADTLLRTIARSMIPGGTLIICDDLLADHATGGTPRSPRDEHLIREFRAGWHVNTLISGEELVEMAGAAGFTVTARHDLSGYIRNGWARGLPVHAAAAVGRITGATSPGWSNYRGGSALKHLGRRGIIRYQLLAFRARTDISFSN